MELVDQTLIREVNLRKPLLIPATIIRQEVDGSYYHRSKPDQYALVNGSDETTLVDFTPVHACLGIAMRDDNGKRMGVHVRKRVFEKETIEACTCNSIVDEIISHWGEGGELDGLVFLSEHLLDKRFPYQQRIIDLLISKLGASRGQIGYLYGYYQFRLGCKTEMPKGDHTKKKNSIILK